MMKNSNVTYVVNLIISLITFLILNIPSVKIIYSTPFINIALFIGLWVFGSLKYIINKDLYIPRKRLLFLVLFYSLWSLILFVTLVSRSSILSIEEIFQYLSIILPVTGIALFLDKDSIPHILRLQIYWALILSIVYIVTGIDLDRSLGQHYLTLGLPLAAGFICSFLMLFFYKQRIHHKLIIIITMLLTFIVLLSLNGRAPFIFSISIPLMIIVLYLIVEKKLSNKLRIIFTLSLTIPFISYLVTRNISLNLYNRIERLIRNIENEPRVIHYKHSINLIKENIFGYGLKTNKFMFNYPHNIFLEVMISGGLISLLSLTMMLLLFILIIYKSIKKGAMPIASSALAILFFLTWNVSYDLSSSYIPFSSIVIAVIAIEKHKTTSIKHKQFL